MTELTKPCMLFKDELAKVKTGQKKYCQHSFILASMLNLNENKQKIVIKNYAGTELRTEPVTFQICLFTFVHNKSTLFTIIITLYGSLRLP